MATQAEDWPPRSPLKTLLSSPSGRKRYQEYQSAKYIGSTPDKLLGSPSLLEKLRAARTNDHHLLFSQDVDDVEEEDEETLQLKIQAIEAKLKLKRLQKQKSRNESTDHTTSAVSSRPASRLEIPVSPVRQPISKKWTSPSRIRLGIDKGLTAADVSLKRARTVTSDSARPQHRTLTSERDKLSRNGGEIRSAVPLGKALPAPKSFSERMAETRIREKERDDKAAAIQNSRTSRFNVDKNELEGYRVAAHPQSNIVKANSSNQQDQPTPIVLDSNSEPIAPNDTVMKDHTSKAGALRPSQSLPNFREISPSKVSRPSPSDGSTGGDSSLYESFSNIDLSSRILPHTFLKRTIPPNEYTHLTVPQLLKYVISPSYSIPDHISDYVVFGIISSKSSPLDHKGRRADTNSTSAKDWEKMWDTGDNNRQKFLVLQLTDLTWTVDLFLFGSAVTRYHRLSQGTVIAILNPAIMPPKKGQEDTGKFSLTLHDGEDQILEIGKAKHLAYCTAKRKDGSTCGEWVNGSKTSICEYHVNAELDKTRSKRMGINSMGRFGVKNGETTKSSSKGWDWESGSYYVLGGRKGAQNKNDTRPSSYAPVYNKNLSAARLLDATNPNDPFIAEGQMLERDKSDRLRRQMAAQQKERDVIEKLGQLGSGGAGGEYMRHRAGKSSQTNSSMGRSDAAMNAKTMILGGGEEEKGEANSKKRTADSVSLSPIKKKTRFVTDRGIREAGRESMGPLNSVSTNTAEAGRVTTKTGSIHDHYDENDDDDLDIV